MPQTFTFSQRLTHHRTVSCLAFNSDGSILASCGTLIDASSDSSTEELCLWSTQFSRLMTSICIQGLGQSPCTITCLLFVGKLRLLVGTSNGYVIDMEFDEACQNPERWLEHDLKSEKAFALGITASAVKNLVQCPNKNVFACSMGEQFVVFKTRAEQPSLDASPFGIIARVAPRIISPHNTTKEILKMHWMTTLSPYSLLIAYETRGILIYDAATSRSHTLPIRAHISALDVHSGEQFLAISDRVEGSLKLYKLPGKKIKEIVRYASRTSVWDFPLKFVPEGGCLIRGTRSGCPVIYRPNGKQVTVEQLAVGKDTLWSGTTANGTHNLACHHNPHLGRTLVATTAPPSTSKADIYIWQTNTTNGAKDFLLKGTTRWLIALLCGIVFVVFFLKKMVFA